MHKLLILFLLLPFTLFAQTPEEETAQKVYLANINTLLIFTQESGLSSGKYRFTKANFKMETYTLPFNYQLEPFNEKMNWFVNGGVGYSITKQITSTPSTKSGNIIELTHDNKLKTYSGGLGGGLRYKSDWGIDFSGGAGLIYSRVGTSVNPSNDAGDAIKDFFDSNYNDNLTYKFFLSADHEKELFGYKTYLRASFKLYETKSDFTFTELSGFRAQSNVSSLSMGVESAPLLKYEENSVTLEPYVKMNFLQGDIQDVVQFNRYMSLGVLAYYNTPQIPSWAERFYLEVSTVRAEGLEGYNVGIGFTIDY